MTILRFFYEGNTPSKKNQKQVFKGKNGRPFITASSAFKQWHGPAVMLMKQQMSRTLGVKWPIARTSQVMIKLFYEDRRRRDATNTVESIMDLLVDAGILADDNWIAVGPMGIFPYLRAGAPGWEIALTVPDVAPGRAEVHNQVMPTAAGARV